MLLFDQSAGRFGDPLQRIVTEFSAAASKGDDAPFETDGGLAADGTCVCAAGTAGVHLLAVQHIGSS